MSTFIFLLGQEETSLTQRALPPSCADEGHHGESLGAAEESGGRKWAESFGNLMLSDVANGCVCVCVCVCVVCVHAGATGVRLRSGSHLELGSMEASGRERGREKEKKDA